MSNPHARRIGMERWRKARERADYLAGYGPEDYPKSDPRCSDGFCGSRSYFDRCVPKIGKAEDYYSIKNDSKSKNKT